MITKSVENDRIEIWDWLLIIGFVLAPMTGLRLWKIGPAESLCLVWSLKYIKHFKERKYSDYLSRFWISFLSISYIGSVYGTIFFPKESFMIEMLTWVYFMFISLSIYEGLKEHSYNQINTILKIITLVTPLWYFFIYLYGEYISSSFFGAPIWFSGHSRFSGGGKNPHQIAILLGSVILCGIRLLFDQKSGKLEKCICIVDILLAYYLSDLTDSSTLKMSLVMALGVGGFLSFISKVNDKGKQIYLTLLSLCIIIFILIIFSDYIYSYLYDWISSDANGLGRFEIYKTFPICFFKSPLIGLGPGIHALNGYFEFHNTYLEVFAMSGLLGLSIFLIFSIDIFKILFYKPMLIMPIVMLYGYGLAGFSMRRLVYWCILTIIIVLAEKENEFD